MVMLEVNERYSWLRAQVVGEALSLEGIAVDRCTLKATVKPRPLAARQRITAASRSLFSMAAKRITLI